MRDVKKTISAITYRHQVRVAPVLCDEAPKVTGRGQKFWLRYAVAHFLEQAAYIL